MQRRDVFAFSLAVLFGVLVHLPIHTCFLQTSKSFHWTDLRWCCMDCGAGSLHLGWPWSIFGWSTLLVKCKVHLQLLAPARHLSDVFAIRCYKQNPSKLLRMLQDSLHRILSLEGRKCFRMLSSMLLNPVPPRLHWTFQHLQLAGASSSSGSPSAKAVAISWIYVPHLSCSFAGDLADLCKPIVAWK